MGTTRRLFLFSFFFLFAYLHTKNIKNSSYEFKDKVFEFTTLVNFKNAKLEAILENPESVFQLFLIIQTICAALAVLGVKFFSFLSGIFLVLLNVLYYNPFKINPVTKKPDLVFSSFNFEFLNSLPLDFFVLSVLILGIFTQSTTSESQEIEADLPKEAGQVSPSETKTNPPREPKTHSQKAKKKI